MNYYEISEIARKLGNGNLSNEELNNLLQNRENLKKVLHIEKSLYNYLSEDMKSDEDIWLAFIRDLNEMEMQDINLPEKVCKNKNLMLKALRVNKKILNIYSATIFDDKDFVLTMFEIVNMKDEKECEFLQMINPNVMKDKEIKDKLLSFEPCKHIFVNLPKEISQSVECMKKYINSERECLEIVFGLITYDVFKELKEDILKKVNKYYMLYLFMKMDVKKDIDLAILVHNAQKVEVFNEQEYRDTHYSIITWPDLTKKMCDKIINEVFYITPNIMNKMMQCREYQDFLKPIVENLKGQEIYNFKPFIREKLLKQDLIKNEMPILSNKRKI